MDLIALVKPLIVNFWWLFIIALLVPIFKTAWFKGVMGELQVKLAARFLLDQKIYHAFHNLLLPTPDGSTQIDHVFLSKFGVFVLETKNMKGWIFGSEDQASWTQQIYKTKTSFQNPLRQNFKHCKALESLLLLSADSVFSVVVFVGDSSFKTAMPANVTTGGGFVAFIKSKTLVLFSDAQVTDMVAALELAKTKTSFSAERQHVARLKSRSDVSSEQLCASCGHPMVLRTSKKGVNQGDQFWGCSQFPKCRSTRPLA